MLYRSERPHVNSSHSAYANMSSSAAAGSLLRQRASECVFRSFYSPWALRVALANRAGRPNMAWRALQGWVQGHDDVADRENDNTAYMMMLWAM